MNLRETLAGKQSMSQARRIADYIGHDPKRFDELVALMMGPEPVIAQRAAYAFMHCTDGHPELAQPYLPILLEKAVTPPHVSIRRNVIRLFQQVEIPEDLEGPVYELCWDLVNAPKETIAVRVFSLSVAARIAEKYPDLIPEVLSVARNLAVTGSAGLRNRAGKIVIRLRSRDQTC